MDLIRTNFLAEEVRRRKNDDLRRLCALAYICLWVASIFAIFLTVKIKESEARKHQQDLATLTAQISEEAPEFIHAVQAYDNLRRLSGELDTAKKQAMEIGFVAGCLQTISETIPDNFWLEQITIEPTDTSDFDDRIDSQAPYVKRLTLKGKVYFDLSVENDHQVRKFEEGLSKRPPFSLAVAQLDLSQLKIGRFDNDKRYYHTFALHYKWPVSPYKF